MQTNSIAIQLMTLFLGVSLLVVSCDELEPPSTDAPFLLNLPDTLYHYSNIDLPAHFTERGVSNLFVLPPKDLDNTPAENPITNAGATLGRVLFYDKNLSKNRTVSCATCHKQALNFSDDKPLSVGFQGENTIRHSMSLSNNRFYPRKHYFWDERAATLEDLILQPFQDPIEMGLSLDELLTRVKEQPYYASLFETAFGNDSITTERIQRSVAQFVRSMVSYQSKYDVGRAQASSPFEDFPNFTAEENLGKSLFIRPQSVGVNAASCAVCHTTEAFVMQGGPFNNGLDSVFNDLGTYNTFPFIHFTAAFKAPSLRNIEVSAPYMHDGRFSTLEEVVEHYNSGIIAHQSVPNNLKNGNDPRRMNYTDEQKAALVAFLKTLTDDAFLTDERFSNPFE